MSKALTKQKRFIQALSFATEEERDDFRTVLANIKGKTGEPEHQFVRRIVEDYGVKIKAIQPRKRERTTL